MRRNVKYVTFNFSYLIAILLSSFIFRKKPSTTSLSLYKCLSYTQDVIELNFAGIAVIST